MLWWPGIGFCVRGFARPWAGGCLLWHNVSSFLLFGITLCQEAPCTQEGAACFVEYHMICNTSCALFALTIAIQGLFEGVSGFDSRLAHHVETSRLIQKYRNAACRKPLAIGVFCYSKANYIDYAYRIIKRHGGFSLVPFLLPLHETPVLHQLAPTYTSPHQKPAYPLYIFSQTLFARP